MVNSTKSNQSDNQKKMSRNSLYMTTFIILIILIFTIPTSLYVYMASTHEKQPNTSKEKQVQVVKKDELPKPKKAEKKSKFKVSTSAKSDILESTMPTKTSIGGYATYSRSSSSDYNSYNQGTETYTVQAKDNIYRIALKYNMTAEELMNLNGLTSPNVSVGQVLRVK